MSARRETGSGMVPGQLSTVKLVDRLDLDPEYPDEYVPRWALFHHCPEGPMGLVDKSGYCVRCDRVRAERDENGYARVRPLP